MSKQLISVIVPVYNEEKNVERAYKAIVDALKTIDGIDYEIIFTDNHSTDRTFEKLEILAAQDLKVRVLRFARNFGFQRSILAGYQHARGKAAIQIDCDLEDPPSVFAEFIRLWRAGHDVVIGLRTQRVERRYMIFLRRFYYQLLDKISDVTHDVDAGDFRLVDHSILDQLRNIDDRQPYVRGLISELASKRIGIHYARNKRELGESKFPLRQLIKLALDGIFSYSVTPLRIASYLGIFISLLTAVMLSGYIVLRVFFAQSWPAGFTTMTVLTLFAISLNALFLGIIGEYIGRIYNQIRKRPLVVIEKTLNVESSASNVRRIVTNRC
jgi:glycosyltransferase involved in cell wall biosynthesis